MKMLDISRHRRVILLIIISQIISITHSNTDCGIDFGNTPFAFVEVKENLPVGSILGNYTATNVFSVELNNATLESSFIDVKLDESRERLYFYLKRPLIEFRQEKWSPSVEIEFNLTCFDSSGGYFIQLDRNLMSSEHKNYIFMTLIEDCNLYTPQFSMIRREFNVTFPWGLETRLNDIPITIMDIDYNPENANVNVQCLGDDCEFFDIRFWKVEERIEGHSYYGYVYPKDDLDYSKLPTIKIGHTFSIQLLATDSLHSTETEFRFVTTKVANNINGQEGSEFPVGAVAGGASALGVVCLLFMSALGYTTVKNRKAKNILRRLTEAEIREFLEGTAGFGDGLVKRSVDVNTPIMAMPYNKAFEIPRDRLRIDETTVLGTGFFGIVMKGSVVRVNGESTTVAVKAVKRNVGVLYFKALLSELKIMSFIGKHSNIVSLIGACTHNIRKREVFIAVEYCSNGNLHNYLRTNRENFINLVKDGKLNGIGESRDSYSYIYSRRRRSDSNAISTLTLIKWCSQVSSGLDYLGSLGVIHGDLATRNILLDSYKVAKIADFGLSRRLVDVSSYYYTKQSQAPLPWKWMAPEALKDMKFSKMSDIWSFGIVLWEIFTLGQTPYPGLNWSENFVQSLEEGLRLGQPQFSPDSIYEVMMDCWTEDPHHRPNAFDIKRIMETLLTTLLLQTSDEGYLRVIGGGDKYLLIGETDSYPSHERASVNETILPVEC